MENIKIQESNTTFITAHCFKVLLEKMLAQFQAKHNVPALGRVTQLYGFGNYDSNLPNLKNELEQLAGGFINGKYLYDKSRELQTGKPIIKLNGFYKIAPFQYIGYDDIEAFIDQEIIDEVEQKKQWQLFENKKTQRKHYYISYHFGEYKEIVKSQVTFLNDWKNAQYKYLYPQKDGSFREFLYHGEIKKRADTLHIKTKTLMDGKMVESGENLLYVGYSEPQGAFILGTFSAFDINNRLIAGRVIHEKCANKEEMIEKSKLRKIPAYIVQEIRNIRIENDAVIPNSVLEISSKSPYHTTYNKIPGAYNFTFFQKNKTLGDFQFSIDKDTFKVSSIVEGLLIVKDNFELIQNGTVIHFSFELRGIALFTKLEVFVKTYYLNKGEKDIRGVFSGLDIENRLIQGELQITFDEAG